MSPVAQGSVMCVVSKGAVIYTVVVMDNYINVVCEYITKRSNLSQTSACFELDIGDNF